MSGKYSVIRSESKLKDLDPAITALYDKKIVAITKAAEKEQEQAEKTQSELIEALVELSMKNADDIKALAEKINVQIDGEDSEEEIREKITKSLEEGGFDIGMVVKGEWDKAKEEQKAVCRGL